MIVKKVTPADNSLIKPPLSKKIKFGCVELSQGEEVGRHKTDKREEVIFILEGTAEIEVQGEKRIVPENNLIYIPPEKMHNVRNPNPQKLKYLYAVSLF